MQPIQWPTPFHFRFEEDLSLLDSEPCIVFFSDAREIIGELILFSPEDGVFEVRTGGEETSVIPFRNINQLRLIHPLHLRKEMNLPEAELITPSDTQRFSVEFSSAGRLEGETEGFVVGKEGLYLYPVGDEQTVSRLFIPSLSIESYQIGDSIGKMLVDENMATESDIQAGLEKQQKLRTQKIGEYLTEEQIVSPDQLLTALKRQQSGSSMRLGDSLIREKLITPEQLEEALAKQRNDRKKAIGEILVSMGVVSEDTVKRMLAKKLGIPFVNVREFRLDIKTIQIVPAAFVFKHDILPLYKTDKTLIVAMENPMHWSPLDELRFLTGLNIAPVMARREDIRFAIDKFYRNKASGPKIGELATELMSAEPQEEIQEEVVAESDNTLVRLVNKMIVDAWHNGVSDIHIESYPGKRNTRIRFRKDGIMTSYFEFPPNFRNALVSRIKIMSRLNISEKRRPQDGKIEFLHSGEKIELRVATVPTANGLEDIVMRVLAAAKPIPIDELALSPDVLMKMKRLVAKPYGLLLICGPTGSGKTTTLHSVLGYINTPERKIWTAEDPVEISQDGLRQVQVNPGIGWNFASAMRSFLRADPDVIMVGEMRDGETARIGIEASLTGHLVLSTLHTNSAPESTVRLLDLGMDPFNFSDALLGVLAQRLARRFCKACWKSGPASSSEIRDLAEEYCEGTHLDPLEIVSNWRTSHANSRGEFILGQAVGCPDCNHTGYLGRIGLHEFLEATPSIKRLVQKRAPVEEIVEVALKEGMRTLKQDGILKILQGHTDIHQIRSVCS